MNDTEALKALVAAIKERNAAAECLPSWSEEQSKVAAVAIQSLPALERLLASQEPAQEPVAWMSKYGNRLYGE